MASIYLPIGQNWTKVTRRGTDDLPTEVKGSVYWTEGIGYQLSEPDKKGTNQVIDVEFINDSWFVLDLNEETPRTNQTGKFPDYGLGTGLWPEEHPSHPRNRNLVLATAPSFGDYVLQGLMEGTSQPPPEQNQPSPQKGKQRENDQTEQSQGGSTLRGKAPEVFEGN